MERLRFQPFVDNRDPHTATLGHRKGGYSERLPSSKRAAEGVEFAWSLLLRRRDRWTRLSGCTPPSMLGTLRSFRRSIPLPVYSALRIPTVMCSLLLPSSWPAGTSSQTGSPCCGIRPARGRLCLWQLQTQSTDTYTCVLGPLVLTVVTGTAAGKQETALSSPKAPALTPVTPEITPGVERLHRLELLLTRGRHIDI